MSLDISLLISALLAILKLSAYIQISWICVFLPVIVISIYKCILLAVMLILEHFSKLYVYGNDDSKYAFYTKEEK